MMLTSGFSMPDFECHEFAELLPTTECDDYASIREDIRAHGQRVPIILYDGKILDGRTRYKACLELRIRPKTEVFCGTSIEALQRVQSHNLFRRHLTPGQKASVAVRLSEIIQEREGIDKSRADKQAMAVTNASQSSMDDVRTIRQSDPVLARGIANGKTSINKAKVYVRNRDNPRAGVASAINRACSEFMCAGRMLHDNKAPKSLMKEYEAANAKLEAVRSLIMTWRDDWSDE